MTELEVEKQHEIIANLCMKLADQIAAHGVDRALIGDGMVTVGLGISLEALGFEHVIDGLKKVTGELEGEREGSRRGPRQVWN